MTTLSAPAPWTLDAALSLIRELQPQLKPLNYHVALGGGVLNEGQSGKDLDLYVLGFCSGELDDIAPVLMRLASLWGVGEPLGDVERYPSDARYRARLKFFRDGQRIDVFIQ